MTKTIRCAIYDRVSTDNQVEHGISLDTQKDALTEYAHKYNYKIVDYYTDEGLTARKKMQNRRELMRLLNDVKADKIDLILVTKLDRWFRNIKDYHNTQAVLEAHHCNWKTIFEDYDTSTSNGRFAINIMLSVNENECDRDSERIKSVFAYKKKNREYLSGPVPYGYKLVSKKLVKDDVTRPIVEDIISRYFSCFSKRNTVYYIREKYGEDSPTSYQINRILGSPTYMGELYGITDYCEPYLTPAQYHHIRKISDTKYYPHNQEPYLFSQLIKCPGCGCNLSGYVKKHTTKSGAITTRKAYKCTKKFVERHSSACLSETVVEEYMLTHILPALNKKVYDVDYSLAAITPASNNVINLKAEISRLNNMFQKGRIDEDYYDEQYLRLNEKLNKEQAEQKIVSLESYRPLQEQFSGDWLGIYRNLDSAHKRTFWRRAISTINVDPETHKLCGFKFLV